MISSESYSLRLLVCHPTCLTLSIHAAVLTVRISGIFAGASMSGDLKAPSKSIPAGTLWAILTTFSAYSLVILSLAASISHGSLLRNPDILQDTSLYPPTILAGELAVTFFSALMGVIGAAKLMQALARDRLFPGSSVFGKGLKKSDEPFAAVLLTYLIAQLALLANLDQLASLIAIFYMVSPDLSLAGCSLCVEPLQFCNQLRPLFLSASYGMAPEVLMVRFPVEQYSMEHDPMPILHALVISSPSWGLLQDARSSITAV